MTNQLQNKIFLENGSAYTCSSYSSRSDKESSNASLSESTTDKWKAKVDKGSNRKTLFKKDAITNTYLEDGDLGDEDTDRDNFYDDLCLDVTLTSHRVPIHQELPRSSDHSSYASDSSKQGDNEIFSGNNRNAFFRNLSTIMPKSRAEHQRICKRSQQFGCITLFVAMIIGIALGISLGLDRQDSTPDQLISYPTFSPVEGVEKTGQMGTNSPSPSFRFVSVTPTTDSGQSSQIITAENLADAALSQALGPTYSQRPTKLRERFLQ
jgi:hypothetical protein